MGKVRVIHVDLGDSANKARVAQVWSGPGIGYRGSISPSLAMDLGMCEREGGTYHRAGTLAFTPDGEKVEAARGDGTGAIDVLLNRAEGVADYLLGLDPDSGVEKRLRESVAAVRAELAARGEERVVEVGEGGADVWLMGPRRSSGVVLDKGRYAIRGPLPDAPKPVARPWQTRNGGLICPACDFVVAACIPAEHCPRCLEPLDAPKLVAVWERPEIKRPRRRRITVEYTCSDCGMPLLSGNLGSPCPGCDRLLASTASPWPGTEAE